MKRIISAVIIFIMLFHVAACGGPAAGGAEAAGGGAAAGGAAVETVTITYRSLAWLREEQDVTRAIIDSWNANNPHIYVVYDQGDWGTVNQELLVGFETGAVPDIFQFWTAPIMLWKERGFLADMSPMLTQEMRDDVAQEIWDLFTTDEGDIIAIPFMKEVDMIFYNRRMFAEAGIDVPTVQNPWNLNDMRSAAERLTNPAEEIYGVGIQGLGWAARFFNDTWATKIDETIIVEADGRFNVVISDRYMELFDEILAFPRDGLMPAEMLGPGFDMNAAFLDERLAMIVGVGNWMRSQFIHEAEGREIDWGMLPPIKIDNVSSYGAIQTLSIPYRSPNREAAMEFLEYFWNVQNQYEIAKSAFIFAGRNSSNAMLNVPEMGWDLAYESLRNLVIPNYVPIPGFGTFMETTGRTIYQEFVMEQIDRETFIQNLTTQLEAAIN